MKSLLMTLGACTLLTACVYLPPDTPVHGPAYAPIQHAQNSGTDYNRPLSSNRQYAACVRESNENYTGGHSRSPVRGQTKAQAYCTCLWNETPEHFKGNLARFAETARGRSTKRMCERHADWES